MMPPKEGKKCQRLPPDDVLSNLPDNVIDAILIRLPCKDVVRTTILSKKWRYHWCRLTTLTLDESVWSERKDQLYPTVKFTKIIYQILTHHEGPITKFKLYIPNLDRCPEIDNFIYFLSRNDIQHLALDLPGEKYRLPSSLFLCSQLRHLNLDNCVINPPSAFKGFDRLITLKLCYVTISSQFLESLISHCPLLEQLVLKTSETSNIIEINAPMLRSFDFTGNVSFICLKNVPLLAQVFLRGTGYSRDEENFDYAKFFQSCFSLEHLDVNFENRKFFADEAPTRLSYDLNCVKHLSMYGIELMESYKLSCALCWIRSFPYLEYLEIEVNGGGGEDTNIQESLELECFSNVTFNHLKEVQLSGYSITTPGMQLIKVLLAKSPVLVKLLINPYSDLEKWFGTQSEILAEVSTFCRASPEAEVVYKSF